MTISVLQRLAIFILLCLNLIGCIYGEKESQQASATSTTSSATDRADMGESPGPDAGQGEDTGPPKYPDVPCEGDESCEEGQTCLEGWCVCAPKSDYSTDTLRMESIPTSFQDGFEVLPFLSANRFKALDTYSTQSPHFLLVWLKDGAQEIGGLLLDGRARPLTSSAGSTKGNFTISETQLKEDINKNQNSLDPAFTYSILSHSTVQRGFTAELFLMIAVKEVQNPSKAGLLILSYPVNVNSDLTLDVRLKSSWLTKPYEVNLTDTIHWGATSFDLAGRMKAESVYMVEHSRDGALVTAVFRQGEKGPTISLDRRTTLHEFKPFVSEPKTPPVFPKAIRGHLEARQGQVSSRTDFALGFSFLAGGNIARAAQTAFHFVYLEGKGFENFNQAKDFSAVVSGINLEVGEFNAPPDAPPFALDLKNESTLGRPFLAQGLLPYVVLDKSRANVDLFQTFPVSPVGQMSFATTNRTSLALKNLHDSDTSYDFTQAGGSSRYFFSVSGSVAGISVRNLVQIFSLNTALEASNPVTLRTSEIVFSKEMSLQLATRSQVLFLKSSFPSPVVEAIPLTEGGTPFCTNSPP